MSAIPGKCEQFNNNTAGYLYPDAPDLENTAGEDVCGCGTNEWDPVCVKTDYSSYTFPTKCLADCKQAKNTIDWTNGKLTKGACLDPCHDNPCRVTGDHCITYRNEPRCEKDMVNDCAALCANKNPGTSSYKSSKQNQNNQTKTNQPNKKSSPLYSNGPILIQFQPHNKTLTHITTQHIDSLPILFDSCRCSVRAWSPSLWCCSIKRVPQ